MVKFNIDVSNKKLLNFGPIEKFIKCKQIPDFGLKMLLDIRNVGELQKVFVLKCWYFTIPFIRDDSWFVVEPVFWNFKRIQCYSTVEQLLHNDIALSAFF